MTQNNESEKEWEALGSRALTPSAISYEPQINSRTSQGKGMGPEPGRKRRQPKSIQPLTARPKGEEEMGRQEMGQLS